MARLASHSSFNRNLRVGSTYKVERTFSAQEVETFMKLTGDNNPIHTSNEAARDRGYRGAILPGWLIASLFPCVVAENFPGAVYASQEIRFVKAELVGRKVVCEVKVSNLTRGLVTFNTTIFSSDNQELVTGQCVASIPMGSRPSWGSGSFGSGTLSPQPSM